MKLLLTLITTLAITCDCMAQQYALTLNLQKDSTYYLTTNANVTMNQTINGAPHMSKILVSGRVSHKVTAIADTVYSMDVMYLNLKMNMDINGQVINMDPADKDRNVLSRLMNSILNKPFKLRISTTGRVLEIKDLDVIFTHMFDDIPGVTAEQKAQLRTQMEGAFGEKQVKGNFQEAFPMLPAKKVTMADKWVAVTSLEQPALININTVYQLKEVSDQYYLIHGDAVMKLDVISKDYILSAGVPMRVTKMSGTNVNDIRLDRKTGWIVDVKNTRNVDMTMQIKDTPQIPGGMTIPMILGSTVTAEGK